MDMVMVANRRIARVKDVFEAQDTPELLPGDWSLHLGMSLSQNFLNGSILTSLLSGLVNKDVVDFQNGLFPVPAQSRIMNTQTPSFQPLRFIPASEKEYILNLPVHSIKAVAHERLPRGGNHWCLHLRPTAGPDQAVIKIDMTPSYSVPSTVMPAGGSKGIMIISHLSTGIYPGITKAVHLNVGRDAGGRELRVYDFVDLLVGEKRHCYEFNAEGQGCRFWVEHQIGLFRERGLLSALPGNTYEMEQVNEAKEAISMEWPGERSYPLAVGAYYT
jgi:hypothetical protein